MVAILTSKARLTLSFASCEEVFLLRKITITVDEGTLECLRVMREVNGVSHSAAIRLAVWAYYQDKFFCFARQKK